MATQIKWVQPSKHNVKSLWVRIREGQFKTASGVPRFQLVKDIEDPDILYLTWTYSKSVLVRCSIDDFPAYLPDEDPELVHKVLKRIARRDLRPPSVELADLMKADELVQHNVQTAANIFSKKLSCAVLGEKTESTVAGVFRETLEEMVSQRMLKGT